MDVEWDPAKAASNVQKHGVSFSDAEPVFYDEFALSMSDSFSVKEERFVVVRADALGRVLTIAYTYRGETIRLISARSATKSERSEYEKGIRS
jgi:uncharacterized DUF497 family protein